MSEMNMQASLLAVASHTAQVSELKRRLEQAEEELSQVRRQLQEKTRYVITRYVFEKSKMICIDRSVIICIEATTEDEALRKALAEAEGKSVKE